MKKAIAILVVLFLFFACNDRETDYTYDPELNFEVTFEDTPIFEDDILQLSVRIAQEDGENFGAYYIKIDQNSAVGKVNFTDGREITQEWEEIPFGTTTLTFTGITSGDYPLTIHIKDPYGKEVEKTYTLKVLSKGTYAPFANSELFITQQFDDIWGIPSPTKQQVSFWQEQLETDDPAKKIDRDDVLVSFINNQSTKNRLDIASDDINAQIQRAYLTLLQRVATVTEIEEHISTGDGFRVIVGRIYRSKEYSNRFQEENTRISRFVFSTTNNDVIPSDSETTIIGNTITATLPFGTPISSLRPTISIPKGAIVTPKSNSLQDFTQPVKYTVTSVGGSTQEYTVILQNEENITEIDVLRKIYNDNPQSRSLLTWDITNLDIGTWKGVTLTNGKVSDLNLSGMRLITIPSAIKELTQLEHLDLNNNLIEHLPSEIGQLSRLKELIIGNNELFSIPPEIGNLDRLTYLNLESNNLTYLPSEIKGLTELTYFDLDTNNLTELPAEIGYLTRLYQLFLRTNELTVLPVQIGQLNRLQTLALENNELENFPVQIGQLRNLQFLYLEGNKIPNIPSEIGQLTELIQLNLSHNLIEAIPTQIGNLTKLTWLTIGDNKLQTIPSAIGQLTELTWLSLGENQLTIVPPEIGNLTKLTVLFLNKNKFESIPPEIGQLQQLEGLNLSINLLQTLPLEIAQLSKLKSLSLIDNQFETLPEVIGQLTALETLKATFNPLTSVPQSICDLQIPDLQLPSGSNFCN